MENDMEEELITRRQADQMILEMYRILRGYDDNPGMVASLQTVVELAAKHERLLYGNGGEGLRAKVDRNTRLLEGIQKAMWFVGTVIGGDILLRVITLVNK